VDRACETSGGSPCTHDTPLEFGLGLEVMLLLFYVVMVVGKRAGTVGVRAGYRPSPTSARRRLWMVRTSNTIEVCVA
jgi:hypothetical protein